MKTSTRILALLTVAIAFLSLPLCCQAEQEYRFEFFGGVSFPFDKNFQIGYPQSDESVNGIQDFKIGPQGGVRLGIDGARHWGQDYTYSYGSNTTRLSSDFGSLSFKTQFHQASSSLLFYPWSLDHRTCLPYLTAGLGATFVVVGQNIVSQSSNPLTVGFPLKSETIFAFHAGGGVRFRVSDRFGFRIDVKDYMSRGLRYGLPKESSNPNQPVLPTSGVYHQVSGTVGLVVHF